MDFSHLFKCIAVLSKVDRSIIICNKNMKQPKLMNIRKLKETSKGSDFNYGIQLCTSLQLSLKNHKIDDQIEAHLLFRILK